MLLVVTPIIKSMANEFIYSPNSRITKFRQACNLNTQFYASSNRWGGCPYLTVKTAIEADVDVGYIYYDTDSNTSSGFVFATRYDYSPRVQNFKRVCFSSCVRLFRIRTWTYYKVDATGLLHADNAGRIAKEIQGK